MVDADFRDFSSLHAVTTYCPQVCCMSATIRPGTVAVLADKIGRVSFSESIALSPERASLSLHLVVTSEVRDFIVQNLQTQPRRERAIIFCLYKNNVSHVVRLLKSSGIHREIFECVSGKSSDCFAFNRSESGIMVSTTVLAAGVSFNNVTRIFFQDGSHGPEVFLQGAGRGARADGQQCDVFLVTSKQQLDFLMDIPKCASASSMAKFCKNCFENGLHFGRELYRLFDHDGIKEVAGDKRSRNPDLFAEDSGQLAPSSRIQLFGQQPCTFQVCW